MAAFVSERTGEAQGALVLLKRAKQLDFDRHFDMIRLFGRAARQLTKKEYAGSSCPHAVKRTNGNIKSNILIWLHLPNGAVPLKLRWSASCSSDSDVSA
jgi:hypothetical protein